MKTEISVGIFTIISVGLLFSLFIYLNPDKFNIQNYIEPYLEPSTCKLIKSYGIDEKIIKDKIDDCQDYLHSYDLKLVRMNENYNIIPLNEFNNLVEECYENKSQWHNYHIFPDGEILFEEYCVTNYSKSKISVYAFTHSLGSNIFFEVIPFTDYSKQSEFFYGDYKQLINKYNVTGLRLL